MATMTPTRVAGTVTITGEEYDVRLNGDGNFYIQTQDDVAEVIGSGKDLDAAVASARRELKRNEVKVEFDFLQVGIGGFVRRTVIGKHRGTRKLLVRSKAKYGGAQPESLGYYARGWRPDAPIEDQERYVELDQQIRKAEKEKREINQRNEINLGEEYENQVEEATTAALS